MKTQEREIKKVVKKSPKKIREQKALIRAIKTPERFFKVEFGRYGGEVAMGAITPAQFKYWNDNKKFEEYMGNIGYDAHEANKDVPEEAQFTKEFYEYGDICHMSGPELEDGQTMTITEMDKDGNALQNHDGSYMEDQQIDMKDFKKKGVTVRCTAEHNSGSESCADKYYILGQYLNKGGWYTSEPIKTGSTGFDFKKMEINYENADGFRVFNDIIYAGEAHPLEEDSTGKSSAFYVMAGDAV